MIQNVPVQSPDRRSEARNDLHRTNIINGRRFLIHYGKDFKGTVFFAEIVLRVYNKIWTF
jgi:hypothetical protein